MKSLLLFAALLFPATASAQLIPNIYYSRPTISYGYTYMAGPYFYYGHYGCYPRAYRYYGARRARNLEFRLYEQQLLLDELMTNQAFGN